MRLPRRYRLAVMKFPMDSDRRMLVFKDRAGRPVTLARNGAKESVAFAWPVTWELVSHADPS